MILKKTSSVCPECTKKINATIIERDKKIFMEKTCKKHGKFTILLSKDAQIYKELNDFYFTISQGNKRKKQDYYSIILTMKCNLDCPICYLNVKKREYKEPTLDFIKESIKNLKNNKIGLLGGEPTMRKDLPMIIHLIKKSNNTPVLYTNGIKLSNLQYLKSLKKAGLRMVHMHLDGFDDKITEKIRGKSFLKEKTEALNNLKILNIPTVIELLYLKGVNEKEVKNVFEYALKHDFIKAVTFNSCSSLGKGKDFIKSGGISEVYSMMDSFKKATEGKISKHDIIVFQKLFYGLSELFNKQKCFYKLYFPIIRVNNGYKTIGEFINLHELNRVLEKYKSLRLKNKLFANLYMLTNLPFHLLNKKTIFLLYDFINIFIQKRRFTSAETSKKLLILSFGTICDQYDYDTESAKYCNGGEISTDNGIIGTLAEANFLREARCN